MTRNVFPGYPRKLRRKLTLAKAKELAKEHKLDRLQMFRLRDDLMRSFPKGTL